MSEGLNGKTKWVVGGSGLLLTIFSSGIYISSLNERVKANEMMIYRHEGLLERFYQMEKDVQELKRERDRDIQERIRTKP